MQTVILTLVVIMLIAQAGWIGYTLAKGQIIINKRATKAEREQMLAEARAVNEEVMKRQKEWEENMKRTIEEYNAIVGSTLGNQEGEQ